MIPLGSGYREPLGIVFERFLQIFPKGTRFAIGMLTGNILQSINWSTNQFYGDAEMSLSCEDLGDIVVEKLPPVDHNGEIGESISKSSIRLRMPFRPEYIGQDIWQHSGQGVFSGPKVMGLADTSMYVCMHAALGRNVVAVLSNLIITFLRPALAKDLIAEAKVIRVGRRLAYLETYLYSDGSDEPIAHATSSFAYRFAGNGQQANQVQI
jgi:uncharacterized protein (TIGR00369 family)